MQVTVELTIVRQHQIPFRVLSPELALRINLPDSGYIVQVLGMSWVHSSNMKQYVGFAYTYSNHTGTASDRKFA